MPAIVCKQIICDPEALRSLARAATLVAKEGDLAPEGRAAAKAMAEHTAHLARDVETFCQQELPEVVQESLEAFCVSTRDKGLKFLVSLLENA